MSKLTSHQIRQLWHQFWEPKTRNHKFLLPNSLVPNVQDKTVLFTGSGMQQLIPNLIGKPHQLGKRLFNIQKCIRTIDIEEVGDHSHHTFFEMMGNWSLGDYFKQEAITWSYDFLVNYLHIPVAKLAVTVFAGDTSAPGDETSALIWEQIGIPTHKISNLDKNWWSPGPIGPCGPDTEIFYRIGSQDLPPITSNVLDDEHNWLEIWNNVFMEYYRDENNILTKLSQQNVDTGMGFERICRVLQGVSTNYETDLFIDIFQGIKECFTIDYYQIINSERNQTVGRNLRIIADHIRTAIFMCADQIIPSNEGRGYILRRIIRRLYYNFWLLNISDINQIHICISQIVSAVANSYGQNRIDIIKEQSQIIRSIQEEINLFQNTLEKGIKILSEIKHKAINNLITGQNLFLLYDTYGFPIELTQEMSLGYKLDLEGFNVEMSQRKSLSRTSTKDKFTRGIDWSIYLSDIQPTKFIGYQELVAHKSQLLTQFEVNDQQIMVFDKSPFYAESGGQTSDKGTIIGDNGEKYNVTNVMKYDNVFLHFIEKN